MSKAKDFIYEISPNWFQNSLISFYNYQHNRKRYSDAYEKSKQWFKENEFKSLDELLEIQNQRFLEFYNYVKQNSSYYGKRFQELNDSEIKSIQDISKLPIFSKEDIRANFKELITVAKKNAYVSKTGGTTGKSLEIFYTWDDFQERIAILDYFRERFGYKYGKKTAWFSGKNLLTERDRKRSRYWKTDYINNIRYYSTFDINPTSYKYYIDNINAYQPEFIVAFPSSIHDLARLAMNNNYPLKCKPKVVFPTAEALVEDEVELMEKYFGCKLRDQYASSEGAPFITECDKGKLHYELLSGVIEVLDEDGLPAQEGEMIVTAFGTKGTPLIRYRIGDRLKFDDKTCSCGRNTPVVEKIIGRINDYIYSNETGKINLGNLSNCVKYVHGVIKFQAIQDSLTEITFNLQVDKEEYKKKDEQMFMQELRNRLGEKISLNINYVENIPREKSGKFQMIKNSVKHLIEEIE